MRTLAILGGTPTFSTPVHVGRPNLGDREGFAARVEGLWERCWLSNDGPLVQEFEQRIAQQLGVPYCVAVCNATIGLELVIRAMELKGEVIIPSYTFVATAHALQLQGIKPVFADIDPVSHNIDVEAIRSKITPRTSGICGVHLWGRGCDTNKSNYSPSNMVYTSFTMPHMRLA